MISKHDLFNHLRLIEDLAHEHLSGTRSEEECVAAQLEKARGGRLSRHPESHHSALGEKKSSLGHSPTRWELWGAHC